MFTKLKKKYSSEDTLYNNILLLSRNKLFYTEFDLTDTFQNRIHLIFIHISFLFIKIKRIKDNQKYKKFQQNTFDLLFNKIELNMRENGFGDVTVNKNMKFLVKTFYNILLNCENFDKKSYEFKNIFFNNYLERNNQKKAQINENLIKYFDKYNAFCFDLSPDSVLKGDFNFNYNYN
tara:strand:- start:348 stop:878 length:531 start_codon:yes stop_codon:yes gene_type:complete